jgi:hypothetical protein
MTPLYIEHRKTEFSCKISKLAAAYSDKLCVGKSADKLRKDLFLANAYLDLLCLIDLVLDEEDDKYKDSCISELVIRKVVSELNNLLSCYCFDCSTLIPEEGLEEELENGLKG